MKFSLLSASALTALLATGALAEDKRQADAHQHGHGVLNVALEGGTLSIEMETPGTDILGFEHIAETEDDKATVRQARETLGDPVALFGLAVAAECDVTESEIEIGADEDDHDESHADKDDHDHEDGHDDKDDDDSHSEVHAHYTLTCSAPAKLTGLDLGAFFAAFPNAEELDAALLTDSGQAGGEITPASPTLAF